MQVVWKLKKVLKILLNIMKIILKTLRFVDFLTKTFVKLCFFFNSSVYEEKKSGLISETHTCNPSNPYGRSKLMCEILLEIYVKHKFKIFYSKIFQCCWCWHSTKIRTDRRKIKSFDKSLHWLCFAKENL